MITLNIKIELSIDRKRKSSYNTKISKLEKKMKKIKKFVTLLKKRAKRLQKIILNKYCSIENISREKPILTPNCQVDPTQRKNVNDLTFQERKDLNKALGNMKTLSDWRSFEKVSNYHGAPYMCDNDWWEYFVISIPSLGFLGSMCFPVVGNPIHAVITGIKNKNCSWPGTGLL